MIKKARNIKEEEEIRERMRRIAYWLDNSLAIPGTRFRIGFDALIGLIPWVGDIIGSLLSLSILGYAVQLGASRWTLTRMGFNILLETVIGAIPIVGDLFDAVWKANYRNVQLLERTVQDPRSRRKDRLFVVLLVLILLLVMGLALYVAYNVIVWLVFMLGRLF
jgi:hypothetical protein